MLNPVFSSNNAAIMALYSLMTVQMSGVVCGIWLYLNASDNKFIWLIFGLTVDMAGVIVYIILNFRNKI